MKVAIYSGPIPSTPFIENLIEGVTNYHDVYLFGTKKKPFVYQSSRIHVIETPTKLWKNVVFTIKRVILLGLKNPKLVLVAYHEAITYTSRYEQWMRFSRFIPVLLYQPDIFHLQWASEINRWMFLKTAIRCKIIVSLRGSNINNLPREDSKIAERYRSYFPYVDAFHSVSDAIKQEAQLYGAHESRIVKIHSILSSKLPEIFNFRPLQNSPLHLFSIGRYHELKGYHIALEAIQVLYNKGLDCSYTIIAKGNPPVDLLNLRAELGLCDVVRFENVFYEQDQLFEHMKTYDIMLLPSLSEGIANVVLEAMALGILVISTDCGGMAEVVKHKETGWLVPVGDSEAMADAALELLESPEDVLENIARNAHNFINSNFNAEDSIQQFLQLYENS